VTSYDGLSEAKPIGVWGIPIDGFRWLNPSYALPLWLEVNETIADDIHSMFSLSGAMTSRHSTGMVI
jgi:hypothetical protein